jgi:hypothetical protein
MIDYKKYNFILTNLEKGEKLHKKIWAEMSIRKKKENIKQVFELTEKLRRAKDCGPQNWLNSNL